MKRVIEFFVAFFLIIILLLPIIIISILIKLTSEGDIIHWSKRIGKNNKLFFMPKFRTMKITTPDVASHLLTNPDQHVTEIGIFLRKFSLDELPQLYSILFGQMTFVGPRPALYNQDDLIKLRTNFGVHKLKPGITGWAQVNGRDEISINQKVEFDNYYCNNKNLIFDLKIIFLTLKKTILRKNISH